MTISPSEVGKRIYEARYALGITQEELAFRVDVSQATISRKEKGEAMDLALLMRIAEALGTTPASLLGE